MASGPQTSSASVSVEEIRLPCSDGVTLAAQKWEIEGTSSNVPKRDIHQHRILCLHGWLDNCRSFFSLAPELVRSIQGNVQVVALDMPGHGKSDHKKENSPPMVQSESVFYVAEALDALGWKRSTRPEPTANNSSLSTTTLIGHSLGAAMSTLYSASFPEDVDRLVLLDGAGFLSRSASDAASHVRKHVEARRKKVETSKPRRVYPSLDAAVRTRVFGMRQFPAGQTISYEAASELVQRSSIRLSTDSQAINSTEELGLQFQHDVRYSYPSLMYYTWEQNEGMFSSVQCATCLVTADKGWPFPKHQRERTLELLRPTLHATLPGSHYFHADPETSPLVAETVAKWISACQK